MREGTGYTPARLDGWMHIHAAEGMPLAVSPRFTKAILVMSFSLEGNITPSYDSSYSTKIVPAV